MSYVYGQRKKWAGRCYSINTCPKIDAHWWKSLFCRDKQSWEFIYWNINCFQRGSAPQTKPCFVCAISKLSTLSCFVLFVLCILEHIVWETQSPLNPFIYYNFNVIPNFSENLLQDWLNHFLKVLKILKWHKKHAQFWVWVQFPPMINRMDR